MEAFNTDMFLQETIELSKMESFQLVRMQVFNWGTYSGLHDIEVHAKGHLIIGRSGTGKSTLLDAYSLATSAPQYRNYNAASNDDKARRDARTNMCYVRGAYAKVEQDGEEVTRYLREGSTASAILLTFKSSIGEVISLLVSLVVKGQSTEKDAL